MAPLVVVEPLGWALELEPEGDFVTVFRVGDDAEESGVVKGVVRGVDAVLAGSVAVAL